MFVTESIVEDAAEDAAGEDIVDKTEACQDRPLILGDPAILSTGSVVINAPAPVCVLVVDICSTHVQGPGLQSHWRSLLPSTEPIRARMTPHTLHNEEDTTRESDLNMQRRATLQTQPRRVNLVHSMPDPHVVKVPRRPHRHPLPQQIPTGSSSNLR